MERRGRIVRRIWAACLALAGLNHARILVQHGPWWDYGGAGWGSAAYWSSLTLLDPLAAVLLLVRPRAGVAMAAGIIATNVVHNLGFVAGRVPQGTFVHHVATSPPMVSQIAFLLFVAATWRMAWQDLRAR